LIVVPDPRATSGRGTRISSAIRHPARRADDPFSTLNRVPGWLTVSRRALYILGLAAFVGMNVSALGEFHGRWIVLVISLGTGLTLVMRQTRQLETESRDGDYRRTYEASSGATFSALYGAVVDLDYKITARDPTSGTLQFKTGSLDLWIPRLALDCRASVRQIDDKTSEVVLAGQADLGAGAGYGHKARGAMGGLSMLPGGLRPATEKILDRVEATVVTYAATNAAPAQPK
jgi:hypothetical protein